MRLLAEEAPLSVLLTRLFQLQSLQSENTSLRRQVSPNIYQVPSGTDYPDPSSPSAMKRRQSARTSRALSMYETGSGLKPYVPKGESSYPEEGIPTLQPFPPHVSKTCTLPLLFPIHLSSLLHVSSLCVCVSLSLCKPILPSFPVTSPFVSNNL